MIAFLTPIEAIRLELREQAGAEVVKPLMPMPLQEDPRVVELARWDDAACSKPEILPLLIHLSTCHDANLKPVIQLRL